MNIAGLVVHARPRDIAAVTEALGAISGVEVHERSSDGRLVVTAEDRGADTALDAITAIHRTRGVLSTSLVYHHCEVSDEPVDSHAANRSEEG